MIECRQSVRRVEELTGQMSLAQLGLLLCHAAGKPTAVKEPKICNFPPSVSVLPPFVSVLPLSFV